jgi:hypothetical protein
MGEERTYDYFMQNGAAAHIADYSSNVLNKAFENRLILCRLWPARFPDLNPSDFYLWGNVKNKVYSDNYRVLNKLKFNICETIAFVSELEVVSNSLFKGLKSLFKSRREIFGGSTVMLNSFKQFVYLRNARCPCL